MGTQALTKYEGDATKGLLPWGTTAVLADWSDMRISGPMRSLQYLRLLRGQTLQRYLTQTDRVNASALRAGRQRNRAPVQRHGGIGKRGCIAFLRATTSGRLCRSILRPANN